MSRWIVDIHGDIEGDYEIIKKYEEPCEDCISRKSVDKIINKWLSHPDYELKDNIYDMTKMIHKLPSVTPKAERSEKE